MNNASIFNLFFIYSGKNDFAKVSKNLAGYRFKIYFVGPSE